MTESRRVILNVIATYGRSLYGLLLGLLCGRWALKALGEVDYGLNGLVGGLAAFISFFNAVLAGANARFYALSIGAAKVAVDKQIALEDSRKWFNTALSVHTIVPVLLIICGYPLGHYAISHWLTIPSHRIDSCLWVFRFVCCSCFVGMINVPFSAMYGAKQYIAELTVYGFVSSTANAFFLYYMVLHPGDWLMRYAAWTCLLSVVPQCLICVRAFNLFPECRLRLSYMCDFSRLKKLGWFSGWQFLGVFCGMLRSQGMSVVINKFFDARMNAAQAIGNTVQSHCATLAGAMQSAFVPVITQACGAKDYKRMNEFVIRMSKFNVALSMLFTIPLALELPEVMRLWLGCPPRYSIGLCYCAMVMYLVDSCSVGHVVAVNAVGKIALFHIFICVVSIFSLPVAIAVGFLTKNVFCMMGSVIVLTALLTMIRVGAARVFCGTSIFVWVKEGVVPLLCVVILCFGIGWVPRLFWNESFFRVCITAVVCEVVYLPLTWSLVLTGEERLFVVNKIRPRICRMLGR